MVEDNAAAKEDVPAATMTEKMNEDTFKETPLNEEAERESTKATEEGKKPSRASDSKNDEVSKDDDDATNASTVKAFAAPSASATPLSSQSLKPSVPSDPNTTASTATAPPLAARSVMPSTTAGAKPLSSGVAAISTTAKNLSLFPKKRKLSTSPPPPPPPVVVVVPSRPTMTLARPLVDPAVTKVVYDIMCLLQTYGPLSLAQLEYNLPPSSCCLQDVLQVMVTLGVVQVVDDESTNTMDAAAIKYCMVYGKPRANVVSSQHLVQDIADAQVEIGQSEQRCQLLKQALLSRQSDNNTNVHPREVLKEILFKYPQVANDPVYMAAFRNTHVDVAAVDRERIKQQRSVSEKEEEEESKKDDGRETKQTEATTKDGSVSAVSETK